MKPGKLKLPVPQRPTHAAPEKSVRAASAIQPKNAPARPLPGRRELCVTPSVRASMPVPKVLQTRKVGPSSKLLPIANRQANTVNLKQSTLQRTASRVVQAVRYFPNLHPGAVEPVNPSNIFRLNHFAGQYRLHQVNAHGVNVPNQQYNFVRTREGEMLLHNRYRHPSLAEGKQVLYAGEVFFNNGQLEWWSNGSGHYQPGADDAEQARLPMDRFFSYQQIIKGEHTRKKG